MENHVHILMAHFSGQSYVRGVFATFHEAVKARKAMEEKKLGMSYSIGSYQVWETFEQAKAEDRL